MSSVVILGVGFAGLIAAERISLALGSKHEVTLVSVSDRFTFYPALVQLAFGKCEPDDISFDLKPKLSSFGVRFIKAEVIGMNPHRKTVKLYGDDINGDISYDYLLIACGRRLATEKAPGFFEYAHHLLSVKDALQFGEAIKSFSRGSAVIGLCPDGRLPVPVCETAFAVSNMLEQKSAYPLANVSVVFPESIESAFGGAKIGAKLKESFEKHQINVVTDFKISQINQSQILSDKGQVLYHDLLMLVPPFRGQGFMGDLKVTDDNGFIKTDGKMRVHGIDGVYAAGDIVAFSGPKIGHMAVRQAAVAADNLIAEARGEDPSLEYYHEIATVIDAGGKDSLYLHYGIWDDVQYSTQQGIFWKWAKAIHDKVWQAVHS